MLNALPQRAAPETRYELYKDETIQRLNLDLQNILGNNQLSRSYSEIYNTVENLCLLGQEPLIRRNLENGVKSYLDARKNALEALTGDRFLGQLRQLWLSVKRIVVLVHNIFLPLETSLSRSRQQKYDVDQMILDAFKDGVLLDGGVHAKLICVFNLLDGHRDDPWNLERRTDYQLLGDVVEMFIQMQMYGDYFEVTYLERVVLYYSQERETLLRGDVIQYFIRVQERLRQETSLGQRYFVDKSCAKAIGAMKKVFIEDVLGQLLIHLDEIDLFSVGTTDDVTVVYDQFKHCASANDQLNEMFFKHILSEGCKIIFDVENESNMIDNLLELRERMDLFVMMSFANAHEYAKSVRTGFDKCVNLRKCKPAQLLAKYVDAKMRDKMTPDQTFDRITALFRHLHEKDVFHACYRRYLAKRLLLGKSSSQDAEMYMIGKLKFECGAEFTSKLEGMFKDIDLSAGLSHTFKQRRNKAREADALDFNVKVLTCGCWPCFGKNKMALCDCMLRHLDLFGAYYKSKYAGRSLEWTGTLDTCLMKAHFLRGSKELHASLFQAGVLGLFNHSERLSFKIIADLINLDRTELNRTLASLTNGKSHCAILNVSKALEPRQDGGFDDDDLFEVNVTFQHKLFRIKINQHQYKDTEEEREIAEDEVRRDRHLQIDAAAVRLMKEHKLLKHTELMTKMFGALNFPVCPNDIKRRIESLIDREFMVRCGTDTHSYQYIA